MKVQYSSGVRPEIEVGAYENKEELIRAITRIEFAAGSTNTGSALEYVRSVAFSIRHGARKGVPKVNCHFHVEVFISVVCLMLIESVIHSEHFKNSFL